MSVGMSLVQAPGLQGHQGDGGLLGGAGREQRSGQTMVDPACTGGKALPRIMSPGR